MQNQTIILDKKLNEFVRKYAVKDKRYSELDLALSILKDKAEIEMHIALLLLYYDCVCFEVYGENILVPYLINLFGEKGFESLLEQQAIKFLLRSSIITHCVKPIKGISPLQGGDFTSDAHKNPEDSLNIGWTWSGWKYDRKFKRNINKKVLKIYKKYPTDISVRIIDSVHNSYKENLFEKLELPFKKDLGDFNISECKKIAKIAENYLELSLLAYFQYSSLNEYPVHILNTSQLKHLKDTKKIITFTDTIFKFEEVPNFKTLIEEGKIQIKDIPNFRKTPNAIKFRKWISTLNETDYEKFDVKEYLDAIENKKNFWNKPNGRLTKTITVNTISTVLAPATLGASLLVGSGISLLDEFYINSLLKDWSPRFFFQKDLKKYQLK